MIVVCKPRQQEWFHKLYGYTVEFFRSLNITVRTLECCSGDLADLKAPSIDVEAWSPRQKFFEVGSCSNMSDAQATSWYPYRSKEKGNYYAHTLNSRRSPSQMLIGFLENNLNADGSINIPAPLRIYGRKTNRKIDKGRTRYARLLFNITSNVGVRKAFLLIHCKRLYIYRQAKAEDNLSFSYLCLYRL